MAISLTDAFMAEVRATLQDPAPGSYWPDPELVGYYNVFVTAVISEHPDALTKTVQFPLAAGVDQVLPDDAVQLLRIPSNVPYAGLKRPGIIQVTAEALQDAAPDWYGKPPTQYVRHVIPDKHDPLRFQVDPPNDGNGIVFLSYSFAPPEATAVTDDFGLTEAYRKAAYHAVVAQALAKGNKDFERSKYHFAQFDQAVGIKIQAQAATQAKVGTDQTTE